MLVNKTAIKGNQMWLSCGHNYVQLKVARRDLYSTAALYIADCALVPNYVVPSFVSRGATTPNGAGALY
jgi:anti-sigma factor ChrR (cupin superfamily)